MAQVDILMQKVWVDLAFKEKYPDNIAVRSYRNLSTNVLGVSKFPEVVYNLTKLRYL